jgi:hypothetical protein
MKLRFKLILLAAALLAGASQTRADNQDGSVARFTAICRGSGAIRPDHNGKLLTLGSQYVIEARPLAGYIFTNWTDGYGMEVTNHPRLVFVMKTNSMYVANFIKRDPLAPWLEGVDAADIPLKVLAAIRDTPTDRRSQVLGEWLLQVAAMNPPALPSVVATVTTAYPNLLKSAIISAVTACPGETYQVVYNTAKTPGADLNVILMAACSGAPHNCYESAQAILAVNPNAGQTILQIIAGTVPQLLPFIDKSIGTGPLSDTQTLTILAQALTAINWPVIGIPPDQKPHDYAAP